MHLTESLGELERASGTRFAQVSFVVIARMQLRIEEQLTSSLMKVC